MTSRARLRIYLKQINAEIASLSKAASLIISQPNFDFYTILESEELAK